MSMWSGRVCGAEDFVERKILLIRGRKVMLDFDLAELYGVETKNLNKAVKRNIERFPDDFMFELSEEECENLRFQIGTSSLGKTVNDTNLRSQNVTSNSWGGRRYLPYAFTEQGIAMLSSVLRSKRAVAVNIAIMRTFVKLREILSSHSKLAKKLEELESKYDKQFAIVFDAIRKMMEGPDDSEKGPIGFKVSCE